MLSDLATPAVALADGSVFTTSLLAAAALTVSTCVAEVIVFGEVLAAVIVGVPACVSVYVKVAVLEPLVIVNGLAGLNVTVPVEVLASVTVRFASAVFGLPKLSCRCTVIVPDATPAVVVTAAEVITSLLAAAALTVTTCVSLVNPLAVFVIVGLPATVSL